MSKKKSAFASIMSFLAVLLLLLVCFGLLCKFTKLGNVLFDNTFCVEYNGTKYKGTENKICLTTSVPARFNVKGANGYKVAIKPNVSAETDFVYTVDGVEHKFSETIITKAFLSEENLQSGYFTLNAMDNYWLETVLSKVYDGKTVVVDSSIEYPYLLTVSSGKESVSFLISRGAVQIDLNCDSIVF